MKVTIKYIDELPALAARITSKYPNKIIAFYGEMSSGKTTFIKELCNHLGADSSEVCSPTYSIVNEYEIKNSPKIYHFDFYRIKDENEAFDMGYEEYFYSDAYCFIEWPEKIANLLPEKLLNIRIECIENERIFTIDEFNS
tara:strand:+ start:112 stop:534 length:423 start_codon:yes stop_codon:yes gene_type:complete